MNRVVAVIAALLAFAPASAGERFTELPEVAPSRAHGEAEADRGPDLLAGGPKPVWVWGDSPAKNYYLKAEFAGGSVMAQLIASGDNVMEVYLNGKPVTSGTEWSQPSRADVQKHVRPEANTLLVKAENQGGVAGFALKLALRSADGKTRYVVTGKDWVAAESKDAETWSPVKTFGEMGVGPWGDVFAQPAGSQPRGVFNVPPGFRVDHLFTVPKDKLGSWVCIAFDPQGRLYASDQGNQGICRVTPAPLDGSAPTVVERLDLKMSAAQGMLFAFGNLYFSVNGGPGSGFYRATDTNADGEFDAVEKLKDFQGGGEHGPHALRLSPDGKSIFVIAGNHTRPPENFDHSRVPSNWDEDLLLPRMWDARGHARGILAPGGWIAKTDPDGKSWEIWSTGYRNAYDMAFNADGELFAYDADMEWDMGTPWYRPTRLVHATSGSEFGWRSGTGKWPTYYPDSLPPVVDIGPGSPVGVEFGYGTKFPAKYQKALYLLDWTFGTMYAIHLKPEGSSYTGTKEEFVSRTPLPLTDAAVGPDGALYFTIGGRGTQSELFRVVYIGEDPSPGNETPRNIRAVNPHRIIRRGLEGFHNEASNPIVAGREQLGNSDRFIRYAARIALEHQPVELWANEVLASVQPEALINGVVALARQGKPEHQPRILEALSKLDFAALAKQQKLELLRAYALSFIRLGEPDASTARKVAERLSPFYPADDADLNRELCRVLVYLRSPGVIDKTLALMKGKSEAASDDLAELLARNPGYGNAIAGMLADPPDTQKLHYAFMLKNLKFGWTLEQRKEYFDWLADAATKKGGASYEGFVANIRKEAWDGMTDAERKALESQVTVNLKKVELPKPHGPGRDWNMEALAALTKGGLKGRDFDNGKRAFAAARCVVCHRFAGEGGATGPDLTNAAGRFSVTDLNEALVLPSKVVSDQYRASVVTTLGGQTITGRVVGEADGKVAILTDPEDPTQVAEIAKDDVDEVTPSPTSLMPEGLLKPLNGDEVLDMLAYVLSRGDPNDPMFTRE